MFSGVGVPRKPTRSPAVTLPIAMALALAGCGGNTPDSNFSTNASSSSSTSSSSTSIGQTTLDAAAACTTVATPSVGYGVGVCATTAKASTVFVASGTTVTVTKSDLQSPSYTLLLDSTAAQGESASVSFLAADIAAFNRAGSYTGLRLSKQVGTTTEDIATLTDFRTANLSGTVSTLTYGSFGEWTRYTTSLQGYQGVWFGSLVAQDSVLIPTTGVLNLAGVAVGSVAPAT